MINFILDLEKKKIDIRHWLALFIYLMTIYLLARNYGLYPSVVDEYTYSLSSRLLPLGDVITPNYFYKLVFSFTNMCGSGWLDCARLINTLFYVASIPIIYLVAHKFVSDYMALLVAGLSIIGPMSSYTAYFMPESMYFLFFWLLILGLVQTDAMVSRKKILGIAILTGLLSLIKPHAFFLIIPIFIFGIYIHLAQKKNIFIWFFKFITLFAIGIGTTKFLIAYYFSGISGLTFFGPSYNGVGKFIFSFAFESSENLIKVLSVILRQIIGHWLALLLIYGLPICIAIEAILMNMQQIKVGKEITSSRKEQINFIVLALIFLLCMSGISAFFTAGLGVQIESEAARLHMRYYNFLLPLILIAGLLSGVDSSFKCKTLITLPLILGIGYALVTNYGILIPNYVDGPEMRGLSSNKTFFYSLITLNLIIVVIWIKKPKVALYFYLFLLYPLYLLVSNHYINIELRNRIHISPYDKAAIFAAQFLTKNDTSNLVMVGAPSALGVLALSQIYIDNPKVAVKTIDEGSTIKREDLESNIKWVSTSGDYTLDFPITYNFKGDGFQLFRIDGGDEVIDFSADRWPGLIHSLSGLGAAEAWGRWSRSKIVGIRFYKPLPRRFTLHIKASPYGDNLNRNFIVRVGQEEKKFSLQTNNQDVTINFENATNSNLIDIIVPSPMLADGPLNGLGVGLIKMRIVTIQ